MNGYIENITRHGRRSWECTLHIWAVEPDDDTMHHFTYSVKGSSLADLREHCALLGANWCVK